MSAPLLSVNGLTGGYGDIQVLWGVDLFVPAGGMVCLIGSNGAGKSTLLRTLSGLVKATGGNVRFAGLDLTVADPEAVVTAGIIHVPEGRRLFTGMSVRDNLLMGAYARRQGAPIVKRDLDRIFEIFPRLKERVNQDATTLSGGEQQMCAIGRGIMAAPQLLMIDELSLGLAPRLVDELCEALVKINRNGVSILLVEQDVVAALELASYGFVLDSGRVTRHGPAAELLHDAAVREAYLGVTDAAVV